MSNKQAVQTGPKILPDSTMVLQWRLSQFSWHLWSAGPFSCSIRLIVVKLRLSLTFGELIKSIFCLFKFRFSYQFIDYIIIITKFTSVITNRSGLTFVFVIAGVLVQPTELICEQNDQYDLRNMFVITEYVITNFEFITFPELRLRIF